MDCIDNRVRKTSETSSGNGRRRGSDGRRERKGMAGRKYCKVKRGGYGERHGKRRDRDSVSLRGGSSCSGGGSCSGARS